MTPDQLTKLEARYTPTTDRPTEPGWYWVEGGNGWFTFVLVWMNDTCDGILRTDGGVGMPITNDYDDCTWTGPIDLDAMLEVVLQAKRLNRETLLLGLVTEERDEAYAVIREMKDDDNPDLWGSLVKQRDKSVTEVKRLREQLTAERAIVSWYESDHGDCEPDDLPEELRDLMDAAKGGK